MDEVNAPDLRTAACLSMNELAGAARRNSRLGPAESAHVENCSLCSGRWAAFAGPFASTVGSGSLIRLLSLAAAACVAAGLLLWTNSGGASDLTITPDRPDRSTALASRYSIASSDPGVVLVALQAGDAADTPGRWRVHRWPDDAAVINLGADAPLRIDMGITPRPRAVVAVAFHGDHSFLAGPDVLALESCLGTRPVAMTDSAAITAFESCLGTDVTIAHAVTTTRFVIP